MTNFDSEHTAIIQDISTYLEDFCCDKASQAGKYGKHYQELWHIIHTYIKSGGKRLRPYLVDIAYRGYGGKKKQVIMPVAAAWELLHTCLLIHDDIIDRDDMRHGELNISGVYKEKYQYDTDHLSRSTALLAGDALLGAAYELVAACGFPAQTKNHMTALLSKALFGVIGGELEDTVAVLSPIQSVSARHIATYKTAEYSVVYPLITGGIAAAMPKNEIRLITDFGVNIGLAYQLKDDLLGVFGDKQKTGKSTDSDIDEKKRTVLLQETYQRVSSKDKKWLDKKMTPDNNLTADDIKKIRQLMQSSGAKSYVQEEITTLYHTAQQKLQNLSMNDKVKQELAQLIEKLCLRRA